LNSDGAGRLPLLLLLEPYLAGSHRAWSKGLVAHSSWQVRVEGLPGRFWKWRMQAGALTLARRWREAEPPQAIMASSMLDLAVFLGLTRHWSAAVPAVYYAHETQLTYPQAPPEASWDASRRRRAARDDRAYALVNLRSMMAADEVWWNSAYHRDSFLDGLPGFLSGFPDHQERGSVARIAARSRVLPVGLDTASLDSARPAHRRPGPIRLLWNHRWEHDKGPDRLERLMDALAEQGADVQLVLLGERFGAMPPSLAGLLERHGPRVLQAGFVDDRLDYARLLWQSDIVLSTARHDFFGVAVAEAMACGCLPILPRDLAYPERLPPERRSALLYDSEDQLLALVQRAVADLSSSEDLVRDRACFAAARALDWRPVAQRYDAALDAILAARG
jgi:glycosyltransferase involved in cell wall biosynthesis